LNAFVEIPRICIHATIIHGVPLSPSFRVAELLLARNDRRREHRENRLLPHITDMSSRLGKQMNVGFGFGGDDAFWEASAVVFDEAVFPFEEFGNGLWLNADFNTAQAGEKKIHLPHESGFTALAVTCWFYDETNFPRF
jgi:hypothetical protein